MYTMQCGVLEELKQCSDADTVRLTNARIIIIINVRR